MSEQTKSAEPRAASEEESQVESSQLTDADLENVAGGATGRNAVVNGGGGYTSAKPGA